MSTVTLSDETQMLLDAQMQRGGFTTADEALRVALEMMFETRGEDYEDLDEETRAAIEEAEAQHQQGLSRPWDEVRAELQAKYVDRQGRP